MKATGVLPYFQNVFWLLLPILVFNVLAAGSLPRAYQMDVFWRDIPPWIAVPENLFRLPVFLLPLILRLEVATPSQRLGAVLYLAGTLTYGAAWGIQIALPGSAWSLSAAGFMAPAYTPAVWLAGIGLIGESSTIPGLPYRPWVYFGLAGVFLAFHNLHAWLVHARG
jgi:hypothetical protein